MSASLSKTISTVSGVALCVVGAVAFVLAYVSAEHPAYVWDYNSFWTLYRGLGEAFSQSWIQSLVQLRLSVAVEDYNPSTMVPLLPVYWLLGDERPVFIASVALVYLLPAAFIASLLAQADSNAAPKASRLALFAALFFTPFWAPTLRGYVDIAGLVPLGLAALLLRKTDYLTRAQTHTAIGFGLLLWCAFLFRRWYAFALVALVLNALFLVLMQTLRQQRPWWKVYAEALSNYYVAAASALIGGILFQPIIIMRIFQTSYVDAYSSYQSDLITQLELYYDHLGLWVLMIVTIGLVADLARKRRQSLSYAGVAILTALLFSRIQAPGLHHILPVALFLFPAYVAGLTFLVERRGSPRICAFALCCVMALNFFSSFAPMGWGAFEPVRMAFPRARHAPLHLAQYAEYQRLIADIKGLETSARTVVFASSFTLSDSLLIALDNALAPRIERVSHVDRRDGFSWKALSADYAIIGAPTQLHLKAEGQRVIAFPSQSLSAGTGVGAAFMDTGRTYQLDDDVTAHLYKRTRPVTAAEISELAEKFYLVYPDWRDAKADIGFGLASARINLGDSRARLRQTSQSTLILRSGETQPISLTLRLDGWFRPLRFKTTLHDRNLGACEVEASLNFEVGGDGASATRVVTSGETLETLAPSGDELKITVFPSPNAQCDVAAITFEFAEAKP